MITRILLVASFLSSPLLLCLESEVRQNINEFHDLSSSCPVSIKSHILNNNNAIVTVLTLGGVISGALMIASTAVSFNDELSQHVTPNITTTEQIVAFNSQGTCLWGQPQWYLNGDGHYELTNSLSTVECRFLVDYVNHNTSVLTESCKYIVSVFGDNLQYYLVCSGDNRIIDSYECHWSAALSTKYVGEFVLGGLCAGISAICGITHCVKNKVCKQLKKADDILIEAKKPEDA